MGHITGKINIKVDDVNKGIINLVLTTNIKTHHRKQNMNVKVTKSV